MTRRRSSPSVISVAAERTNWPADRRLGGNRLEVVTDGQSRPHDQALEMLAESLELADVELDRWREVADEREPDAAGQRSEVLDDGAHDVVGVSGAVDVDVEVVDLADRNCTPLSCDPAVRLHRGEDGTPLPVLAELERVGVARVRVALRIARDVVMAEERVCDPARIELGRVEGGMRPLARLLPGQRRPLRGVGEGQMHATAIDAEAVEEAIGVRGSAVGGAPESQAVVELDRAKRGIGEEMDVRRPFDQCVRAALREPVVVPRCQEDAAIGALEGAPQELYGVRTDAVLLEQVAAAQDGVDRLRLRQRDDASECLAPVPSAGAGGLGRRPRKRRVEVEIGEMEQFHGVGDRVVEAPLLAVARSAVGG